MYKEKFQITYIKPRMDIETAFFLDKLIEHVYHRGKEAIQFSTKQNDQRQKNWTSSRRTFWFFFFMDKLGMILIDLHCTTEVIIA